jgi:hypothetical protein
MRMEADLADKALRLRDDLSDEEKRELRLSIASDFIAADVAIRLIRGPVD